MKKVICFGAAGGAKRLYSEIAIKYEIVMFVDNDERKWGGTLCGLPICSPKSCVEVEVDFIIITSAPGLESIHNQLLKMGLTEQKIITSYVEAPLESRRIFLRRLSNMHQLLNEDVEVAEAGVFAGDFARYINEYYPNRVLHLFDTFEGFTEQDIQKEKDMSLAKVGDYSNTSVELVLDKMPVPDKIIVHKGYFPNTAQGVDSRFCFVNLDLDLYEPTYQGLHFFADKMVTCGVILVHDYFADNFKGPKKAVDQFIREKNGKYQMYPIGDGISVMIVGF